jgi:RNA polymerase sigma-70 factor (ECF subfamily)
MTDLQLFERIKNDDSRSFESLFDNYFLRLCSFACQFVKAPQISEEIVSGVFTAIWLRRKEIHIEKSVKSYLYRSVRNHAINYLKSEKKQFTDVDDELFNEKEESHQPDSELIFRELEAEIEVLICSMPRQRQAVFRLSKLQGMKYAEIAKDMGISVNTVQNHMVEANKYMSKHYDKFSVKQ